MKYRWIILIVGISIIIIYPFLSLRLKINSAKAKYRALKESMLMVRGEKKFSPRQKASLVIDELTRKGRKQGISFLSLATQDIKKEGSYLILPIEIEMEGGYKELGVFLGSLDDLKKALFTVESFTLRAYKGRPEILRCRLILSAYLGVE